MWVLSDSPDIIYVIDTTTDTLVKSIPLLGITAFVNDIAFSPDSKIAVVTAADAGQIAVIDANNSSNTFGSITKTLSTGGYVTTLAFLPNGKYFYVVNETGGYILAYKVSTGIDSLESAIEYAIKEIQKQLSAPGINWSTRHHLQTAIARLQFAIRILRSERFERAKGAKLTLVLDFTKQAIRQLMLCGIDTTEIQKILAEGARIDTEVFIKEAEAKGRNCNLVWQLYEKGVNSISKGDYFQAVICFEHAISRVRR
jgi:WD40 repeat protein